MKRAYSVVDLTERDEGAKPTQSAARSAAAAVAASHSEAADGRATKRAVVSPSVPVFIDLTQEGAKPKKRSAARSAAAADAAAAAPRTEVVDLVNGDWSPKRVTCGICLDDVLLIDTVPIADCRHRYCDTCCMDYVKKGIEDGKVGKSLTCPAVEPKPCRTPLSFADVRRHLGGRKANARLLDKYDDFTFKRFVEANGADGGLTFSCPTPGCGCAFERDPRDGDVARGFQCPACAKEYCLKCKCEWHEGVRCEDRERSAAEAKADAQFFKLVHSRRFKQCPECRRWVEKEDGCNHMICVCSAKFCYRCGNSLKGGRRYSRCRCGTHF